MSWTSGYTPDQWSAAGTWLQALGTLGTLAVAVVAALFARRQVLEAKAMREDQAQPFVTASLDPSHGVIANLVIRNQGRTAAHDVRFSFSPEYEYAFNYNLDFRNSKLWREGFPTLVPGQTVRLIIDQFAERYENRQLPRAYDVRVTFKDAKGREYSLNYVIDFDAYYGYGQVRDLGIHEVAKSLQSINTALKTPPCQTRSE